MTIKGNEVADSSELVLVESGSANDDDVAWRVFATILVEPGIDDVVIDIHQ